MAVAGALIGKALGAFGEKPSVPELPRLAPGAIQQAAIQENLAALPEAAQLASAFNLANRKEATASLEANVPGAQQLLNRGTASIASLLRGELPADVSAQIQRNVAESGVSGGFAGSGFAGARTARDLGLTSLQLTQAGISSAQSWLAGAQNLLQPGGLFNLSSMFFSPQERLAFEERDRAARFERDLLKAQVDAAPDPADVALAREIDRFFNTAASVGMMAAGGMGGGPSTTSSLPKTGGTPGFDTSTSFQTGSVNPFS